MRWLSQAPHKHRGKKECFGAGELYDSFSGDVWKRPIGRTPGNNMALATWAGPSGERRLAGGEGEMGVGRRRHTFNFPRRGFRFQKKNRGGGTTRWQAPAVTSRFVALGGPGRNIVGHWWDVPIKKKWAYISTIQCTFKHPTFDQTCSLLATIGRVYLCFVLGTPTSHS